jgi:hypothetical protein
MGCVEVYRDQFEALAGPFREWPDLACLVCNRGALEISSFTEFESKDSADDRVGAETEEGPKRGFFHGELTCSRAPCGNRYVVAGEWARGTDNPDEEIDDLDSYDPDLFGLTVRHILPPLPLISLPDRTPDQVAVLVGSCSSVLLSDPNAGAGRIRTAIEALLDQQGIRKTGDSRTERLSAHARLKLLSQKNGLASVAAEYLLAVKLLGNEGAHERLPVPLSKVLEGVEFFARTIEILYDPRDAELARKVAEINRKNDEKYERIKEARKARTAARKAARRRSVSSSGDRTNGLTTESEP